MKTIQRLTVLAWFIGSLFYLVLPAVSQVTENAIRFDISPRFSDIQPVPKAQGAFLKEHRVKKLPPPAAKGPALPDSVRQTKAAKKLQIGPVVTFPGVGEQNY